MANSNGGVIILGIEKQNNGIFKTTGLKSVRKLIDEFWKMVNNPSEVSFNLLTKDDLITYEKDGDQILVVKVPRAGREVKPIYINNDLFRGTYRRIGTGDYHCSGDEVRAMLRDEIETSDSRILTDMNISVLNKESIQAFRSRHRAYRPNHTWETLSDEEYLERIGAVKGVESEGKFYPTVAGLLMFGEEHKIRYEFPEYFLEFYELLDPTIHWTDRVQSSSGD